MDMSPEMIALGTELASIAGKKSVEAIFDKIKTVKQKGNKDEIIGNLEEIINELIADKNSLIQISRAYEEKLITQKITDTEIDYITQSIIPLLEQLIKESNPAESQKMQAGINMIKPILSKETFNILQILGFNFKKAIGEPMTEWIASLIKSKINDEKSTELQLLIQKREIEYLKLCQDKDSFQGSVKNFVALVKNGSFLVRITDMTILIEKEFIYGSSKRPNPTDYYRKQHYQCGGCLLPSQRQLQRYIAGASGSRDGCNSGL